MPVILIPFIVAAIIAAVGGATTAIIKAKTATLVHRAEADEQRLSQLKQLLEYRRQQQVDAAASVSAMLVERAATQRRSMLVLAGSVLVAVGVVAVAGWRR